MYTLTITEKGSRVGTWEWNEKEFSGGQSGYFTNGALNIRIFSPRLTITDGDGNVVMDKFIPYKVFSSGKTGFYMGGPDSLMADDKHGILQFSAQIITSVDKRTGRPVSNRHRFQVMAYATAQEIAQ